MPNSVIGPVYRIAMEAMQNVIKHAEARLLTLDFSRTGPSFKLCIRDDGKGIENLSDITHHGFGFRNMKQHAEMLSGTLSIDSKPGVGTCICLSWEEKKA